MGEVIENERIKINGVPKIIVGIIVSFGLTIVFLLIYSMLLTYTDLRDNTIPIVVIGINTIAILIGSSIATIKLKKNGIFHGAIIGILYMGILYLISSIFRFQFEINMYSIFMLALGVVAGAIGGILGVNIKQ